MRKPPLRFATGGRTREVALELAAGRPRKAGNHIRAGPAPRQGAGAPGARSSSGRSPRRSWSTAQWRKHQGGASGSARRWTVRTRTRGKRTGEHPTARGRRTGAIDTINGGRAPDSWRALHRSVGPAPAAGAWLQTAKPRKPQTPVPLSARALPAARSSLPFGGPARVARGQAQAGPDLPSLTAEPGQVGHQAREEKRPPGVIKERIKGSLRVILRGQPPRGRRGGFPPGRASGAWPPAPPVATGRPPAACKALPPCA